MKTVWLVSLSAAVLSGGVSLATKYSPDHSLRCDITLTMSSGMTMEATRDGQPVETPGRGGMSSDLTLHEVHVDHAIDVTDGHPVKVKRTFEKVSGEGEATFGDNTREIDLESPLEGVTLEIVKDKEGKCEVSVADGKKPEDAAALDHHQPDLFLDALLPEGDVEAKATWDLQSDAVKHALRIDVGQALYPPPAREDDGGGPGRGGRGRGGMTGGDSRLLHQADFSGKAKLVSTDEEVDGQMCAKIEIKIEASGEMAAPERGAGGPRRRQGMLELEPVAFLENHYDIRLEGEMLVSLKDHHPVSLELEGTINSHGTSERERDGVTTKMTTRREGKLTYKVKIEAPSPTK
jgi:hypothetical protein